MQPETNILTATWCAFVVLASVVCAAGSPHPRQPLTGYGPGSMTPFDPGRAIYWADFTDAGEKTEWSRQERFVLKGGEGTRQLLGRFGNEPVSLRLSGLPRHRYARIYFEFLPIGSWDGLHPGFGIDVWQARLGNGPRLVYASFSNTPQPQSFPLPYGVGNAPPFSGGRRVHAPVPWYDRPWTDHAVYPMSFVVPHTDDKLSLHFSSIGLQEMRDESWALECVGVQLLDRVETTQMDVTTMQTAWQQLSVGNPTEVRAAMDAFAGAADAGAGFLCDSLGWGGEPRLRDAVRHVTRVLAYDDLDMWSEAAAECRRLGPRVEPFVIWKVDERRFSGNPPPWLDELFGPAGWRRSRQASALREGRAARVLELIWNDTARRALLFEGG